jgi:hypothetical protein
MVDQLFKDFDVDNDDKLVTFPVPLWKKSKKDIVNNL